jgi:tetratricopeptide (TPR) repeat protein
VSRSTRQAAASRRPAGGRPRTGLLLLWFGAGLIAGSAIAAGRASMVSGTAARRAQGAPAPESRSPGFDALVAGAFARLSSERHADALEDFFRAARMAPEAAEPYLGMGTVYAKLQLYSQAEKAFREALRLDPTCWPARHGLARILGDLGRHEEAIAFLREIARDQPDAAFVWAELGLNALRMGKPSEAIPLIEKYLTLEGGHPWGHAHLGRALADLGETDRAEASLRKAVEIEPRMALARLWLGQLLIKSGRREEGERHLKIFRTIGDLTLQSHRLEQRLAKDPDDLPALIGLARIRALLGKASNALIPIRRAMELAPQNEEVLLLHREIAANVEKEGMGKTGP